MEHFHKGDKVTWKWGTGKGVGIVKNIYTYKVTKTIKGKEISRNGEPTNPVYYIETLKKSAVLKFHHNLKPAE